MSVVTTPSISVLNNELNAAGNGPISIYSNPAMTNNRKSVNGADSDSDTTLKLDNSFLAKPSSSASQQNNGSVATSPPATSSYTVQMNSMPSAPPVVNRAAVNNGASSTKRSTHIQGPMAILTPCSNSHPFDERRIPVTREEERAVKFGRAVARFQPAQNNAIFDCKVLSRNHAILWYEDDQFFIKDTRSSNGTFVNNQRLSSSGEESTPRVLHSGDILQLGVDIIDHAQNGSVPKSRHYWKKGLSTRKAADAINEVGEACQEFFDSKPKKWYFDKIRMLAERWQKIVDNDGLYFEE